MNEWPILVKYAVGVLLFIMMLGAVNTVVYVSNYQANKQADTFASKVSFEDYSEYNNRVVDKPAIKNILRSNKDRLPIYLDGSANSVSSDPAIAHTEINNFLSGVTRKYKITIAENDSGVIMKVEKY